MYLARTLLGACAALALAGAAQAQTPGSFPQHQQLGSAALNAAFASKMDYSPSPTFTGLTLSGFTGSVQCLHVNIFGQVLPTGSDCGAGGGGGGSPGGSSGQLQYNNGGVFGGLTISGDGTLNTTTGALTVTETNGVAFGTAATANTGTSGGALCLLNAACTWSASPIFNAFITSNTPNGGGALQLNNSSLGAGQGWQFYMSTNSNATNTDLRLAEDMGGTFADRLYIKHGGIWQFLGPVLTPASTTSAAGFNVAPGSAPTSPNNGDVWTTSGGGFVQINGATQQFGAKSGTWTPTYAFTTPGTSSFSYSTQSGHYWCSAGLVYIDFNILAAPTKGTASGSLLIAGLPYAVATVANPNGTLAGLTGLGWTGLQAVPYFTSPNSSTTLNFVTETGSSVFTIGTSQVTGSAGIGVNGAFVYQTSSAC